MKFDLGIYMKNSTRLTKTMRKMKSRRVGLSTIFIHFVNLSWLSGLGRGYEFQLCDLDDIFSYISSKH